MRPLLMTLCASSGLLLAPAGQAATANYDAGTATLTITALQISGSSTCFDVNLRTLSSSPTVRVELVSATAASCTTITSAPTPSPTPTPTPAPAPTPTPSPTPAPTPTPTPTPSANTERTLDNCTTTVAAGVPAFYKTFFKCVDISLSNGDVVIKSNNLPPHKSYYYGSTSPNYTAFDNNNGRPNAFTISSGTFSLTVPSNPVARNISVVSGMIDNLSGTSTYEYPGGTIGVGLDSVALFAAATSTNSPLEDETRTFDSYNAHVSPTGAYHYHSLSKGPVEVLKSIGQATTSTLGAAEVEMFGILCDGTVVLGCTELDGSEPDRATLDAQNGHVGDIKGKDGTVYFTNRYHVHLCPSKWTNANTYKWLPEIQYYNKCTAAR